MNITVHYRSILARYMYTYHIYARAINQNCGGKVSRFSFLGVTSSFPVFPSPLVRQRGGAGGGGIKRRAWRNSFEKVRRPRRNKSRCVLCFFRRNFVKVENRRVVSPRIPLGPRGKVVRDRVDFFPFFFRGRETRWGTRMRGAASFYHHTSSRATISRWHCVAFCGPFFFFFFIPVHRRDSRHKHAQGYINFHGNFINDRRLINDRRSFACLL